MFDATEFAPVTSMANAGQHVFTASHGDDRGLVVEFYMEAVEQVFESEQQGRPIFKDVPFIHIFTPGGKSDLRRQVKLQDDDRSPSDPRRFPNQWAAFSARQEQGHDGTPLEQLAFLKKSQVQELKSHRIHTLEQLAVIPDSAIHNIGMGARELRDKAKAVLANADGNAEVLKLRAENDALKTDLEALKTQVADLAKAQKKDK